MDWHFFFYNKVNPATWVHLSSLLTIAIFFKFSRLWSVRNLDLLALILVAPGLLAVQYGQAAGVVPAQQWGFIWLFVSGLWFLVRLLLDSMMVRRPLLEPNLSAGGMLFLGITLFVFMSANVLIGSPETPPPNAPAGAAAATGGMPSGVAAEGGPAKTGKGGADSSSDRLARQGPGYPPLFRIPNIVTQPMAPAAAGQKGPAAEAPTESQRSGVDLLATRIVLIMLHLAVVVGLVLIGYRHFDNVKAGIAAAVLYLMLPYTAEMDGHLRHVLPAAPLVWAIVAYRRPLIAGLFMGLAMGLTYYPLFLLPLWISFYWQRGLLRFLTGTVLSLAALAGLLWLWAPGREAFLADLQQMFGWVIPQMSKENFEGFWGLGLLDPVYRIPVLAAFIALSATMAIWPAQKNLGTLMSCSAALMLASQFWNAHNGGLFFGWYLPLLLLTVFRPNLEDRVALTVLGQGWFPRRAQLKRIERAA